MTLDLLVFKPKSEPRPLGSGAVSEPAELLHSLTVAARISAMYQQVEYCHRSKLD